MNKVIVTGGAGFVGSHLVERLLENGDDVTVIDDMSSGKNINPDARLIIADVRDADACAKLFDGADMVYNLAAAVGGVDWNMSRGLRMFESNVITLVAPVIAAQEAKVGHFLQMSSTCIVSPAMQGGKSEEWGYFGHPHVANWGYGQSKRDGEYAALYWSSLPHVVAARSQNMFGPRDHFEPDRAHVIPALINRIHAASDGDEFEVYGSPDTVREFLYVEDCADAMVHLMNNTHGKEAYNIGTGGETAVSIRELVFILLDLMNKDLQPYWNASKGGGDDARRSNVAKLRATGWEHKTGLIEGLEKTLEWYYEEVA